MYILLHLVTCATSRQTKTLSPSNSDTFLLIKPNIKLCMLTTGPLIHMSLSSGSCSRIKRFYFSLIFIVCCLTSSLKESASAATLNTWINKLKSKIKRQKIILKWAWSIFLNSPIHLILNIHFMFIAKRLIHSYSIKTIWQETIQNIAIKEELKYYFSHGCLQHVWSAGRVRGCDFRKPDTVTIENLTASVYLLESA